MGMVGGQAIDVASTAPNPQGRVATLGAADLQRMHGKKTGALILVSGTIGAILGGATNEQIEAIGDAGSEFGLAFQIVDDILDVEGVSADLGKTAGKDATSGKPTYPSMYGVETSRRMARECLERAGHRLASAGVADQHLLSIGRWIVERRT